MCADKLPEPSSAGSRIGAAFTWLGGGHSRELVERHERSTHAIAGVVVLLVAVLAWFVATLAVAESTQWPTLAIVPLTLVFGLLVGAVIRATVSGPKRGWPGIVGRGAVAVAVGVVVGELAALVLFSGPIDRRLEEQAARNVDAAPAVVAAAAGLARTSDERTALDDAVEQARRHRDEALVVARCEYNPTPACPQTRITGVPGSGPETRTAKELLADAQRELDNALATSYRQAPELTSEIADGERALTQARETATVDADRGLGARWVAMQDFTLASAGALLLRMITIAFFALLSLLPLIIRLWRGETTHDLSAAARAERHRAELAADTAIAVKRAEVRAAAETLWADQQLANARLAVEAQTEIDRVQYRRRVSETLDDPIPVASQRKSEPRERKSEPREEDMYLPIAAEAEAAAANQELVPLPAGTQQGRAGESQNLPAPVDSDSPAERGAPLIPSIPEVTRAAARWIRPLVPPLVARAIDTTTHPLRAARQVFEEVEEITFALKRTHKVTIGSEESADPQQRPESAPAHTKVNPRRIESSFDSPNGLDPDHSRIAGHLEPSRAENQPFGLAGGERRPELTDRDGPRELGESDYPRQLPPGR